MKLKTLGPTVRSINTGAPVQVTYKRLRGRGLQERNTAYLAAHPMCAACLNRIAVEVDHIYPLCQGGCDGEPNLQGLCVDCHKFKTANEAANRGGYEKLGRS